MPINITPTPAPSFALPSEITGNFSLRVSPLPVTNAEWAAFLSATGYAWDEYDLAVSPRKAVTEVSRDDAAAYCKWFSTIHGVKARMPHRWEQEVLLATATATYYKEGFGYLAWDTVDGWATCLRLHLHLRPRLHLLPCRRCRLSSNTFRLAFNT